MRKARGERTGLVCCAVVFTVEGGSAEEKEQRHKEGEETQAGDFPAAQEEFRTGGSLFCPREFEQAIESVFRACGTGGEGGDEGDCPRYPAGKEFSGGEEGKE